MRITVKNKPRNPLGTQSYWYHSGTNPSPGGDTETVEVTPYTGRTTGTQRKSTV